MSTAILLPWGSWTIQQIRNCSSRNSFVGGSREEEGKASGSCPRPTISRMTIPYYTIPYHTIPYDPYYQPNDQPYHTMLYYTIWPPIISPMTIHCAIHNYHTLLLSPNDQLDCTELCSHVLHHSTLHSAPALQTALEGLALDCTTFNVLNTRLQTISKYHHGTATSAIRLRRSPYKSSPITFIARQSAVNEQGGFRWVNQRWHLGCLCLNRPNGRTSGLPGLGHLVT